MAVKIAKLVVPIAVCGTVTTAAFLLPRSKEENLTGPPLQVKVGATKLCVGRQFVNPTVLTRALIKATPITGYPYERVELNLFSVALTGLTAEHYRAGFAKLLNKQGYPSDWVRITVWAKERGWRYEVGPALGPYYEPESTIDAGFQSHRARRDCMGKIAGSGWTQIENGPECLDDELKHNHPAHPEVIFHCSRSRCWLKNQLQQDGVWFDYDFPRAFLQQWPTLHSAVERRISEWKQDRSCYP